MKISRKAPCIWDFSNKNNNCHRGQRPGSSCLEISRKQWSLLGQLRQVLGPAWNWTLPLFYLYDFVICLSSRVLVTMLNYLYPSVHNLPNFDKLSVFKTESRCSMYLGKNQAVCQKGTPLWRTKGPRQPSMVSGLWPRKARGTSRNKWGLQPKGLLSPQMA